MRYSTEGKFPPTCSLITTGLMVIPYNSAFSLGNTLGIFLWRDVLLFYLLSASVRRLV